MVGWLPSSGFGKFTCMEFCGQFCTNWLSSGGGRVGHVSSGNPKTLPHSCNAMKPAPKRYSSFLLQRAFLVHMYMYVQRRGKGE